jgi:hypothetical protein
MNKKQKVLGQGIIPVQVLFCFRSIAGIQLTKKAILIAGNPAKRKSFLMTAASAGR